MTFRQLVEGLWRWLRTWRWPLLTLLVFWLAMSVFFGWAYWKELCSFVTSDPKWWAENTITLLVFTILVGWIISIGERERARMERRDWEGWELHLVGLKNPPPPTSLFWEDVQRFHHSDFEYWKFVKSAVSNICRIRTMSLVEAEKRWLRRDPGTRRIVIDFSRMECGKDLDEREFQKLEHFLKYDSKSS